MDLTRKSALRKPVTPVIPKTEVKIEHVEAPVVSNVVPNVPAPLVHVPPPPPPPRAPMTPVPKQTPGEEQFALESALRTALDAAGVGVDPF